MSNRKTPVKIEGIQESLYGGFWLRVLALIIDGFIMFIPAMVMLMISNINRVYFFYTFIPYEILGFWYCVYLIKVYGGSPGKLLIGLKIIRLDGADLTWVNAVLRYIPDLLISLLHSAIYMNGLLKIDDESFGEHTWMTKTTYVLSLSRVVSPVLHNIYHLTNSSWNIGEVISLLADKRRRALHDFLAGTIVVKAKYIDEIRRVMNEPENTITGPIDEAILQTNI